MKAYILTIKHDNGSFKLRVNAENESTAIIKACNAENCPEGAITKIRPAQYPKTIDKIITKVNSQYGAPMGRPNVDNCDYSECNGLEFGYTGRLFDCAIPLDSGGYDRGGAYWGIGKQLRVEYNKDLTWIRFYRKN